ncbi:MAG: short-chain dehydrogenase/reductase, partial [Cytophagaceae bacterium]
ILKQADADRKAELETWESVSLSTDHQEAVNFLNTEQGQSMFKR